MSGSPFPFCGMIATVSLEKVPGDALFDYRIPGEFSRKAVTGARVMVPFGRRTLAGYVICVKDASDFKGAIKDILSVEDSPLLLPSLVELAVWMAGYYCSTVPKALEVLLPAPVRTGSVREKRMLFVECAGSAEGVTLTARQRELLDDIKRLGGGWQSRITRELGCTPSTLRRLEAMGLLLISEREKNRSPLLGRRIVPSGPLPLNGEQRAAFEAISSSMGADAAPKPFLLFGVTGSGKTEVYLQVIAAALEKGLGAIVLVPEISLTPQTVHRFASRFGHTVAVLHSSLSAGERFDEWQRLRKGEARVAVGPRSALFAPIERLGVIIVDEEHEPSYKQEEAPRYSARDCAVMRARMEKCAVVLGSATPSLESWHNAQKGKYRLLRLSRRASEGSSMPLVHVVDMANERSRKGFGSLFSEELLDAVGERLSSGEQVILFLNRRGYSTSFACPSCGQAQSCPGCEIPYTYHKADSCLRCHVCGGWQRLPEACPFCGEKDFRFSGTGTQRIEAAIKKCFPRASVARMDADSTSGKTSHDDILDAFRTGKVDILIGTQMIAKGLHFPRVTLAGILNADASLNIPDFRASERTFQLLAQVSGRTGRGSIPGEVYIQTASPGHIAVQSARTENYEAFAKCELASREQLMYPPYAHITVMTFSGPDERTTELFAGEIQREIKACCGNAAAVSDLAPALLAKADNLYRFQILLKGPSSRRMTSAIKAVLAKRPVPQFIRLAVDVDAYTF